MPSQTVGFPSQGLETKTELSDRLPTPDYEQAEKQFINLLAIEDLDKNLDTQTSIVSQFEKTLNTAITTAYQERSHADGAHLFLQRVLYRINRLKLFWYDDLRNYSNERSIYLRKIRDQIEAAWQAWESDQIDVKSLSAVEVRQALLERSAADLEPEPSADGLFFQNQVTEKGYRRLLAIASLDGLVEASQLSRMLGGVANEVHSVLTRLLVEEYGGGRLGRKHSSYFETMLKDFGMQTKPEAYFELVPWELLATINHSFLLSERKRYFLRYIGGLLYSELSVPAGFSHYRVAADRLGLSGQATAYWDLHIKVDELHGRWMLDDVALPLIEQYPDDAWELVFGYDQQRFMSDRAGAAVTRSVRAAEQTP
jgi:hypothetical protein